MCSDARQFALHRWLAIGIAFVTCLASPYLSAKPQIEDPYFQIISSKIGLSQNYINDIKIDRSGFVWIASEGGLDRWDGHNIVSIPGPDSRFVNASIRELFVDRQGDLWISTFASGIYRYNLEANTIEQVIEHPYKFQPEWIQHADSFIQAPNGDVIVGLSEEVVRYHPDTQHIETLFRFSDEQMKRELTIRYLLLEGDRLFVATSEGVISLLLNDPNSTTVEVGYLGDSARDENNQFAKYLLLDLDNRLWITTLSGVYMAPYQDVLRSLQFPHMGNPFKLIVDKRNVWDILPSKGGHFWLGTDIGLMKLTQLPDGRWQSEHVLEPHNGAAQLSKKSIITLAQDRDNNLWLGTAYGGALYWSPKSTALTTIQNNRYQDKQVLSNGAVWSFLQTDPGHLWIGTENGLNRYDFSTGTSQFYLNDEGDTPSLSESSIEQIMPAPEGNLLVQTMGGMRLFDTRLGKASLPPVQAEEDQAVFQKWNGGAQMDGQGRVYFIADDFYRYDPKSHDLSKLGLSPEQFSPTFSSGFLRASSGFPNKLFLAMQDSLWMMDCESLQMELVYQYTDEQVNNSVAVSSLALDSQGVLWLAFPRFGIIALDGKTFALLPDKFLNKDNLLASNVSYGLQIDDRGDLWFSSHNGLHLYSPLRRALKNFEYGQELRVAEFNEGASYRLLDGRFAYGSTNGVVIFDPLKLSRLNGQSRLTQSTVISDLTLESRPLQTPMTNLAGRHFDLRYDDFGLAVHFSSMLTGQSNNPLFKYQLYRNRQLLNSGETREAKVTFGYLPAGDYRFEVTPKYQPMDYTLLPAQLTFNMPYAPFRSPLYYTLYGFMAIGLLLLALNRQKRGKQRWQQTQQQMKLFGEAFQQTRDWVVIFDASRQPMAANPSFKQVFSINEQDNLEEQLQRLYLRHPKLKSKLRGRISTLLPGEYWKDEDVIEGDNGKRYDVLFDVTAIQNDRDPSLTDHYLIVISDITEQKNAERKLLKMASYDSLTGLVNRNLLLDRLEHAIANAKRHDSKLAVLFVDLDRFKGINDSLGHDFGDKLLKVVANRMLNLSSSTDTVARLGGDEFVIVIEEVQGSEDISSYIGKLIESIEQPIKLKRKALRVSCSVGVSFYPDDATDAASLLHQADIAMYSAKRDNLVGYTFFTQEMNEKARLRLILENQVKLAFDEEAFCNHYQPIIDVQSGQVEGVELLLRMESEEAPLSAAQFIPVLEQLRLIIDVTRMAITRAVEDIAEWRAQGFGGYVSVNLSALHFKTELDIHWLNNLLAKHAMGPETLRFEITEGVLVEDGENAAREINRLIEAGYKLALDDFGTGYSSLSYLRRFALQVLKIDKSFVEDISKEEGNDALVLTTIHLASSLNMTSVAEGVETREQAEQLASMGCYHHQGFYYSKAVPADQVPALFQRQWPVFSGAITRRWAGV